MTRSGGRTRWVLKIGGSLDDDSVLAPLIRVIGELAASFDILIIPGGGRFADFIRERAAARKVSDDVAHAQAVLAMAQYGHELAGRIPKGKTAMSRDQAEGLWREGFVPVFIPYPFAAEDEKIPRSWDATSDTIAARVAEAMDIPRLVLLKSVDGARLGGRLLDQADARIASGLGIVDPELGGYARPGNDIYIINGRAPERLEELIMQGRLAGRE